MTTDVQVSSKVTTGTHPPWWRVMLSSAGWAIWLVCSVVGLGYAVFKIGFDRQWLDSGDYMFYGAILIVFVIGLLIARASRAGWRKTLECECPACGMVTMMEFDADPPIRRCDRCGAYCRANGTAVSELPLDTLSPARFIVESNRYFDIVRCEPGYTLNFEMPPFCAVCGAADAPHTVPVEVGASSGSDRDGFVAQEINYQLTGKHHASSGRTHGRVKGYDLEATKVPVCAAHTKPDPRPMSSDDWGMLGFTSYRYYKAFVAANRVRPPQ